MYEVQNTFLEGMYMLKKEEYKALKHQRNTKCPVREKQLYHVTSAGNVASILKDNFNWQRVRRSRFGRGTSFSDKVKYADKYANDDGSKFYIMILSKHVRGWADQAVAHPKVSKICLKNL